jgi:ATPase subunit of ABC transporter with duplicated ATPase domains
MRISLSHARFIGTNLPLLDEHTNNLDLHSIVGILSFEMVNTI